MLCLVVGHTRLAVSNLSDGVGEGLGGLAGKVTQVVRNGREDHGAVGSVGCRCGIGHGHAIGSGELKLELAFGQAATLKDLGSREGRGSHRLCLVVVRERGVGRLLQRGRNLAVVSVDELELVGSNVL